VITMRKPIIAGNWKMHKTVGEAVEFARALVVALADVGDVEVVVCPPAVALKSVGEVLRGSAIGLGAQNMHWEEQGPFTGEISPRMLVDVGCRYVILGHSERRQHFGESDAAVNKKVHSALRWGLIPIVCVGERLEERQSGRTDEVVRMQLKEDLAGLDAQGAARLVIAYEPVWAIGTGLPATGEEANRVSGLIREILAGWFGEGIAQEVRIQYGGSVSPHNISEFLSQPEVDGALVGGASLDVESFSSIVQAAIEKASRLS
jgi:triosephosphate isomerase